MLRQINTSFDFPLFLQLMYVLGHVHDVRNVLPMTSTKIEYDFNQSSNFHLGSLRYNNYVLFSRVLYVN